jgi:iron complex outermembrane receptor protein
MNNYISGGIDYAISKKLSASYDVRIIFNNGNSYALNPIEIRNFETGVITGRNESDIDNSNASTFIGNTLSTKYKIDSAGSEWTSQLEYNYYKNNNDQLYRNSSFLPAVNAVTGDGENRNRKDIFVLQTDLTLKLPKKYTLEAGVKATFSKSENSAAYFKDTGNNIKFVDIYQTNTFRYKESIVAAYVQLSKTFSWFYSSNQGFVLKVLISTAGSLFRKTQLYQ